jgi:hypothetical protein
MVVNYTDSLTMFKIFTTLFTHNNNNVYTIPSLNPSNLNFLARWAPHHIVLLTIILETPLILLMKNVV